MKKRSIRSVVIGAALAVGLALSASIPAEAATLTQYCNWPQRAAVQIRTAPSGTVIAYSPGGTYMGSKGASTPQTITWYTPWEDIRFVTSGYISSQSTWCY